MNNGHAVKVPAVFIYVIGIPALEGIAVRGRIRRLRYPAVFLDSDRLYGVSMSAEIKHNLINNRDHFWDVFGLCFRDVGFLDVVVVVPCCRVYF